MCEWPLIGRIASPSSTSPTSSRHRRRRTRATAFAALSILATLGSPTPTSAFPLPIPFLDFLYPSVFALRSSPTSPLPPPSSSSIGINAKRSSPLERRTTPSTNSLQRRDLSTGLKVPVKFEPADIGWIVADSWDLHGRHRRSDPSDLENSTSLGSIQTLDITDPYGGSIIETSDTLDLPEGWHQASRHENYDPVIVSVFAVFLVLSIITTIGLCKWRTRKLRKIRDIERLARKEKGELDSDDETIDIPHGDANLSDESKGGSSSDKPRKEKKQRLAFAKSSALRKVNDRLTARLRRKHRSKNTSDDTRTSNPDVISTNTNTRSVDLEHASSSAERRPIGKLDGSENVTRQSSSLHADEASSFTPRASTDVRPHSPTRSATSRSASSIRPPRDGLEAGDTPRPIPESPVPTSLPPAYLSMSSPHSSSRRAEKAPLRGLEAEYDERDLDSYRRDRSRAPSRVHDSVLDVIHIPEEQEEVPPFEPSVMEGTSRVAAGATRQAHVATDDKRVLERLRSMADEPEPSSLSALRTNASADPPVIVVPAWSELDEWETRRQIEEHMVEEDAQCVGTSTTVERRDDAFGPLLPPPPSFSFTSSSMLSDPSSNYTLGPMWSGMAGHSPLSTSASLTPSAPPHLSPMLAPSAPPQLDDEEAAPSAPPAWIEDESEAAPSAPPLSDDDQPSENSPHDASNLVDERNNDSDGAESIMSAHEGSNRWSTTLRTSARDGAGLPRYEP